MLDDRHGPRGHGSQQQDERPGYQATEGYQSPEKVTSWALHDASQFDNLIQKVIAHIDDLENLFPAPTREIDLVQQEVEKLQKDLQNWQDIELLNKIAQGVDRLLRDTTDKALEGHQYFDVQFRGQVRGQNGDLFLDNWSGKAVGASHKYNGGDSGGYGKGFEWEPVWRKGVLG